MKTTFFNIRLTAIGMVFLAGTLFGQQPEAPLAYYAPQQSGQASLPLPTPSSPETTTISDFSSPIQLVAGPGAAPAPAAPRTAAPQTPPSSPTPAPAALPAPSNAPKQEPFIGTKDSELGHRLARITMEMEKLPEKHKQISREFDITPYTKGRQFPSNVQPEQTIIDWILRQTGPKMWHVEPFGILSADAEKIYAYHTKEVMLLIADVVDRFVSPQYFNETYTVRVVTLARADWVSRGHQYLRPIPIATPGVQGWILDEQGSQLLLQELGQRTDYQEIAPPQFLIPNGMTYSVAPKKARTYLRDVQPNPGALNGYAEDRVTIEEGFSLSFTPLACLDGMSVEAIIKLNVVQIEKMITAMIDVPTVANPRQRVQIESPQVACFELDEQIRWGKDKVLLLDLGTVPLPSITNQQDQKGFLAGIARNMAYANMNRANVLLMIKRVNAAPATGSPFLQQQPQTLLQPLQVNPTTGTAGQQPLPAPGAQPPVVTPAQPPVVGTNPLYWNSVR